MMLDSFELGDSGEGQMEPVKLSETLIGREVERLFCEPPTHGSRYENPVTGGRFIYGIEPIEPQKEAAYRALLAREWFALNGPADAPQLPIPTRNANI
jgi:hypothetical protein